MQRDVLIRAHEGAVLALPRRLSNPRVHRGRRCHAKVRKRAQQRRLHIAHVHRLSTRGLQRHLKLSEQIVIEVGKIVRVLDAYIIEGPLESIAIPHLDGLKPLVHCGVAATARLPHQGDILVRGLGGAATSKRTQPREHSLQLCNAAERRAPTEPPPIARGHVKAEVDGEATPRLLKTLSPRSKFVLK